MALFHGNLRSKALNMDTQLCVILPHDWLHETTEPARVLYLLHGLGENASSWHRFSQVEWYVRGRNIAVIMPEVQRSFYTDMVYGANYYTYITEELPDFCQRMFGISNRREDTCIAGLSMGGFGALKCALNRPDLYAACGSFSGAVDAYEMVSGFSQDFAFTAEMVAVMGQNTQDIPDEQDPFLLTRRVANLPEELRPYLLVTCGESDILVGMNRRYRDLLETLPLQSEYLEWPGIHDWTFWNRSIELAINKFFGSFDYE